MNLKLSQKVIYITGASRGIGLATARLLLEQGAIVIANARNAASASCALNDLQAEYPQSLRIKLYDVTDQVGVKTAAREVQKEFGAVDGLVNNAGMMYEAAIAMTRDEALQDILNCNVQSAFLHLQLFSRMMLRHKAGSIVNVSSVVAQQGARGQSVYSMSKAALEALTKSAAKELGPSGIRVNAVAPGFIETHLTSHYSAEQKRALLTCIPINRLGCPEDVANSLAFLLSPYASYITGQTLGVDGALSLPN